MKLRKIYYVPGLISAILIPLLFWFYGSQKLQEPLPNVMNFGIPPIVDKDNYKYSFEPLRKFNYKKIVVQPNTARKNSKYYVSELKNLQTRNEKNTGIEFIINDKNSYDDFISILNDMEISKQEHYGIDMDKTGHIFAVHFYKDSNKTKNETNYYNGDVVYYEFPDDYYLKGFQKFEYQLSHLPKNTFYLIFGYLILLNISVLSLARKFV